MDRRSHVLLCDADGCLFPSEEPAYEASAIVTSQFLDSLGIHSTYSPHRLRQEFTGANFRATATQLALRHGVLLPADALERWVRFERVVVTQHLADTLEPDRAVLVGLERLSDTVDLALVSSSAVERIDVSLRATDLSRFFRAEVRFSAESLRPPISKPAPAVYLEALRRLRLSARATLAVEDSVPGTRSAVAAGIPAIGILHFVAAEERSVRRAELNAAGAMAVVDSWAEVTELVEDHYEATPRHGAAYGVPSPSRGGS